MNNPEKHRPVMTMHKMNETRSALMVGKVFTFPGTGDAYQVSVSGAVRRLEPKLNKKERRANRNTPAGMDRAGLAAALPVKI